MIHCYLHVFCFFVPKELKSAYPILEFYRTFIMSGPLEPLLSTPVFVQNSISGVWTPRATPLIYASVPNFKHRNSIIFIPKTSLTQKLLTFKNCKLPKSPTIGI